MKRYKATASTVHFYLDDNGPWCDVRDVDARIAELTAEVASLKDALNDIQARVASGYFVDANHLGEIARNALKDG